MFFFRYLLVFFFFNNALTFYVDCNFLQVDCEKKHTCCKKNAEIQKQTKDFSTQKEFCKHEKNEPWVNYKNTYNFFCKNYPIVLLGVDFKKKLTNPSLSIVSIPKTIPLFLAKNSLLI